MSRVRIVFIKNPQAESDSTLRELFLRQPHSEIKINEEDLESIKAELVRNKQFPIELFEEANWNSDLANLVEATELMIVLGLGERASILWLGEYAKRWELKNGDAKDILPTALNILKIEKPTELRGSTLLIDPRILMNC